MPRHVPHGTPRPGRRAPARGLQSRWWHRGPASAPGLGGCCEVLTDSLVVVRVRESGRSRRTRRGMPGRVSATLPVIGPSRVRGARRGLTRRVAAWATAAEGDSGHQARHSGAMSFWGRGSHSLGGAYRGFGSLRWRGGGREQQCQTPVRGNLPLRRRSSRLGAVPKACAASAQVLRRAAPRRACSGLCARQANIAESRKAMCRLRFWTSRQVFLMSGW